MGDFRSYCEEFDSNERLAELDLRAEDLVFFQEGRQEFADDDFGLDITDIQFTFGKIYQQTFSTLLDGSSEKTIVGDKNDRDKEIGRLMKEIHRLSLRVHKKSSRFSTPSQALESAINKIIVHNGVEGSLHLERDDIASSEAFLEILQSMPYETQQIILEKSSGKNSLVRKLEEPLMTTKLWAHQKEALKKWIDNDFQGYVDMATATGKTVLGLATIAALYGELHPEDQTDATQGLKHSGTKIMVVAHDNLVLEQWGREFDEHLEIPRKFTGFSEDKELTDISLNWGQIDFLTGQKLKNMTEKELNRIKDYDLLILDEIHKYQNVVGRMSPHIENKNIKIIALSGSIDTNKSERQKVRNHLDRHLPFLKKYTIQEAREDNIIPDFSWNVTYTIPQFKGDTREKLEDNARLCKEKYKEVQENEHIRSFDSYEEAKKFRQTIEGKNLREDFDCYDTFVHAIFARGMYILNLRPSLNTMAKIIEKEAKEKKCLALVTSNPNVDRLKSILISNTDIDEKNIVAIGTENRKAHEQRSKIDEFDESDDPGVIIGTGKRLGVGVDFMNIEAIVNATPGRKVNKSLIQRMGRMLRNPEDKNKTPVFYNVIPILKDEGTRITEREGRSIVEGGAQYLGLADLIECEPGEKFSFSITAKSLKSEFVHLESAGIDYINSLIDKDAYKEPSIIGKDSGDKKSSTTYLNEDILKSEIPEDESLILSKWGEKEEDKEDRETEKKKRVKARKQKQKKGIKKDVQKEPESSSFKKKIKGVFGKVKKKLKRE